MVFTIDEIKNYLSSQKSIKEAIANLSEGSIVSCITDISSLNFEKSTENLDKYEMKIGMYHLKEEQRAIYRNSNGQKGKCWMACSPRWILNDADKDKMKTKYDIGYWVNYGDDETYGWFSVEQIQKWLSTPKLKLYELGGTRERVSK